MGRARREAGTSPAGEIFVSYASHDRDRVAEILATLGAAGIGYWLDRERIAGGFSWGSEISRAIQRCKVMMLMCTDAALRSREVKQEIQLAWKYGVRYLPLVLEPVSYPEQVDYWLEGWQWVDLVDRPSEEWLPRVLRALALAGAAGADPAELDRPEDAVEVEPIAPGQGLAGLLAVARLTDQIWPVPADRVQHRARSASTRGLGAPQLDVQHSHPLGSRVCLALEANRDGHLLLLDRGPEDILYCLCPSWFAPETRLRAGRSYLPQAGARYASFRITGRPGRENLLAILSDDPLGLNWMTSDARQPSRILTPSDVEVLLTRLRRLPSDRWMALSTYFEITD